MCLSQTKASLIHSALSGEGWGGWRFWEGGYQTGVGGWGGVAVLVILYSVQRGGAGWFSGGYNTETTPGPSVVSGGVRRSLHLSVHGQIQDAGGVKAMCRRTSRRLQKLGKARC